MARHADCQARRVVVVWREGHGESRCLGGREASFTPQRVKSSGPESETVEVRTLRSELRDGFGWLTSP